MSEKPTYAELLAALETAQGKLCEDCPVDYASFEEFYFEHTAECYALQALIERANAK